MNQLGLALACGLGALIRYGLSPLNRYSPLPLGTLLGNLIVAFLAGYISQRPSSEAWGYWSALLGGLGTYSTFNRELLDQRHQSGLFLVYLALTYGLGAAAVALGRYLAGLAMA